MSGNDSNAVLLLHCNGTDASTDFEDDSLGGETHLIGAGGNAQKDTAQKKFGTASALFDGAKDFLDIFGSNDWAFGTGDFCVDFWLRFNSVVDFYAYDHGGMGIFYNSPTQWEIKGVILAPEMSFIWSPSVGVWYHVAFTRGSGTCRMFIDGVQIGSSYTRTGDLNEIGHLTIGANNAGTTYVLNGWMDEIRISKGTARWTANFTAPSSEYTPDNYPPSAPSSIVVEST